MRGEDRGWVEQGEVGAVKSNRETDRICMWMDWNSISGFAKQVLYFLPSNDIVKFDNSMKQMQFLW